MKQIRDNAGAFIEGCHPKNFNLTRQFGSIRKRKDLCVHFVFMDEMRNLNCIMSNFGSKEAPFETMACRKMPSEITHVPVGLQAMAAEVK